MDGWMDGHILFLIPTEPVALLMHFSYALYKLDLKYLNICSYAACMCVCEHSTRSTFGLFAAHMPYTELPLSECAVRLFMWWWPVETKLPFGDK